MNPVKPVLVAACACLSLAVGCSSEEPPVEVVRPVISIVVADVASFRESTLPGRAKAAQEANLAFEVPGKLIERPAEVGDRVERGQLLARLDPRDYEAQLLSAQGAYRTAKADYERAEALLAEGALAENVRDRRRAAFEGVTKLVGQRPVERILHQEDADPGLLDQAADQGGGLDAVHCGQRPDTGEREALAHVRSAEHPEAVAHCTAPTI